jgi:tripartite ATP-independent transporter DctP family solute receptor
MLWGCAAQEAEAVPEHVFRYAENQPADYPTTAGAYKFAELVEERTEGRIKIVVYHSAELGNEPEVIAQLRFGGVDFARLSLSQLAEVSPALGVLQLPYLYRDEAHMWRVLDGEIGNRYLSALDEGNIDGLSWYNAGSRSFYTTMPVSTPGDLSGLSIRVQESRMMGEIIRLLGATPVPIPYGDVYSALQTGRVDGAENNWPSYESMAHSEVAPYFYKNEHIRLPEMQVMSKLTAAKLSDADMEIIRLCAKESAAFQRGEWIQREKSAEENSKARGVEVAIPSRADILFMELLLQPIYETYAAGQSETLRQIIALRDS